MVISVSCQRLLAPTEYFSLLICRLRGSRIQISGIATKQGRKPWIPRTGIKTMRSSSSMGQMLTPCHMSTEMALTAVMLERTVRKQVIWLLWMGCQLWEPKLARDSVDWLHCVPSWLAAMLRPEFQGCARYVSPQKNCLDLWVGGMTFKNLKHMKKKF